MRFEDAFASVIACAVERGDLPQVVDGPDLAAMLEPVALLEWAAGRESVAGGCTRHAEVIFTGASVLYGWSVAAADASRSR